MRPENIGPASITELLCPLCGSGSHEELKAFADGVIVGECRSCHLLYTPKRHSNSAGLFAKTDGQALRILAQPIITGRFRHYRHKNFESYLEVIRKHSSGRRLLDIGSVRLRRSGHDKADIVLSGVRAPAAVVRAIRERIKREGA